MNSPTGQLACMSEKPDAITLDFDTAMALWRGLSAMDKNDPEIWELFSNAEVRILRQSPQDMNHAAAILEVLIDMADSRDDGLDHRALMSIRDLLLERVASNPTQESPPSV